MTQQDTFTNDTVQFAANNMTMNMFYLSFSNPAKKIITLFFCFYQMFWGNAQLRRDERWFFSIQPNKKRYKSAIVAWSAKKAGTAYDSIIHAT